MSKMVRWFVIPALLFGGACGDDDDGEDGAHDHDGSHDAMHDHTSCGIQANCMDEETLAQGLTVESDDGAYSINVHMHSELMTDANEWMIGVADGDGIPLPNTDITSNTYSEDCGHYGDEPMEELTTDDTGMVTIHPDFIHGGPWSVRIDVDADGSEDVIVQLCVPGGEHGAGQDSEHEGASGSGADEDHSGHMQ